VNVYAESSAVLAWLLGEDRGGRAEQEIAGADLVVTSDLTLIECDRVLNRAAALGERSDAEAARRRAIVSAASEHWVVLAIDSEVVARSRQGFPREPVRTLDAIHLSTALLARNLVTELQVLSLDERIRGNAAALGFDVAPGG
jgi:uncharacterized protein with PIN domain